MEALSSKKTSSLKNLGQLSAGARARIYALGASKSDIQAKLLAMGILPGRDIHLMRKFPSFVFQVGNSQFTVDREIAQEIFVCHPEVI
ncbi:MAG: ferrous iron transport protein A [Deltaproteobacteria bacterium]|nr:ferrous iron transport protein A [Deltaproteobacteria bacterium]